MNKFIQVEISVEIIHGDGSSTYETEMVMLNEAHIIRFTTSGNFIWTADGQRYAATQRGINHLMEAVEKYGVKK